MRVDPRSFHREFSPLLTVALMVVLLWPALAQAIDAAPPCVAPPATTTLSPKPGTDNDPYPTFSWEVVPAANYYQLWINKGSTVYKTMWLFGETSYTPSEPLGNGAYTWWVETASPCGSGSWAAGGTYVVDCDQPSTPSLIDPSDGTTNTYPAAVDLRWEGSELANWSHLVLNRNGNTTYDEWIQFPFGYGFRSKYFGYGITRNGFYEWTVQEWSPCGGLSEWSDTYDFTLAVPACTSAPPKVSYVEVDVNFSPMDGWGPGFEDSSLRPEVRFGTSSAATWYRVRAWRNGTLYRTAWVGRDGSGYWAAESDFPAGTYQFVVTAYNQCGFGEPSDAYEITLACGADDTISNLTALPCGYGFGYGFGLNCAWDVEPGVSWYQVLVAKDGRQVYNEWLDLDRDWEVVDAPSGSGRVEAGLPVPCTDGSFGVWVRGWNPPCGVTDWAGPAEITFDCTLTQPVLTGPAGDLTTPRPTLEWMAVADANRYNLWVGRNGVRYHTQTLPTSACGTESTEANSFSEIGTAQGWNGDDNSWELELPFSFPFCGSTYTSCYVSSNGTISFDDDDSLCCGGDESWLADEALIAVMWGDLHTDLDAGDDIYIESNTNEVTIRWQGGYCCDTSYGDVNISATLYADGTIRLSYGEGNPSHEHIIGISAGNNMDYLLSSRSGSAQNMTSDIVYTPGDPSWRPFWNMATGNYTWYVQPESDCAGGGTWSAEGTFNIVSP